MVYWFGAAVAVLHLVMNFTTLLSTQWQSTLHFVGLGVLAILLFENQAATLVLAFALGLAAMGIVYVTGRVNGRAGCTRLP